MAQVYHAVFRDIVQDKIDRLYFSEEAAHKYFTGGSVGMQYMRLIPSVCAVAIF